ncbi:MAG: AAA family ATPase, partial [Tepidisphaeraceae bacterium]
MNTEDVEICFGPYRLCRRQARLLRDGRPVPLTPKAMDVLHHLARRPGELVGKQELLAGVWPDVIVGDASVKVCIREVRRALGDFADDPKYIQTVHRRGYRFIAEVVSPAGADATKASPPPSAPLPGAAQSARPPHPHPHPVVGRETELAELGHRLACAAAGQRQTLFITGEIGTGKTALVEAFVHELQSSTETGGPAIVAVGNCFERFGPGEPYLPVWEAIGRIPIERRPGQVSALLARQATPATSTTSPAKDAGGDDDDNDKRARPTASSARILRDMIDAFESFPEGAGTLVLILEDLHWADYSTLDLISGLARRRSPARLMVIG